MLCKLCKQTFPDISALVSHCKDKHKTRDGFPTFTCSYDDCNRQYHIADSFRSHLKTHQAKSSVSYFIPNEELVVPVSAPAEPIVDFRKLVKTIVTVPPKQEHSHDEDVVENYSDLLAESMPKNLNVHAQGFQQNLFHKMVDLLADESLPRNKAISIVQQLHTLYVEPLRNLFDHLQSEQLGDAESNGFFEFILNPKLLMSEYSVVKEIEKLNAAVEYTSPVLDSKYSDLTKKPFLHTMKLFKLTDLFTKLFNLPNFINEVLEYIFGLDDSSEWIHNVVQSPYWRKIKSSLDLKSDEMALPLYIYNDDFEPLHVLGSHRGAYKLSGVYMYIPCFPPEVQSKLQYIFPAMLFFSSDRSSYKNARIFTPLIDELNKLQVHGVKIEHKTYKVVKLIPILLLGDNLGLNSMMGFVQCFVANFYCRICKRRKDEMATADADDIAKRRTRQNYENDCKMNDSSLTGIVENLGSVWNSMHNFHVVNNLCVDIMHDLFEGACHIVLCEILYAFIYKEKYFTLAEFNRRLKIHDFGPSEKNKNITPVTPEMISKRKCNTSAAEMLLLFTNFGVMIGDLVPEGAREWSVYLLLREIISIVLQKKVHRDTHHLLKELVSEHHIEFQNVFRKKLTPKLHFMIHYAFIMEQLGPISGISSMRFESFHCVFKHIIKNNNCRKDILESCFFKIRMRYASMFLKFKSIRSGSILTGKKSKVLAESILRKYDHNLKLNDYVYTTNFVESNSVKLKVGHVSHIKNENDETPIFAVIEKIILDKEQVLIGYNQLLNLGFDDHYNCYKVEYDNVFCVKPADFNLDETLYYIFKGTCGRNFINYQ